MLPQRRRGGGESGGRRRHWSVLGRSRRNASISCVSTKTLSVLFAGVVMIARVGGALRGVAAFVPSATRRRLPGVATMVGGGLDRGGRCVGALAGAATKAGGPGMSARWRGAADRPSLRRRLSTSSLALSTESPSDIVSYSPLEDATIFALSSGGGGAGSGATAVSVIRLTGPRSHDALRRLLRRPSQALDDVKLPKPRLSSLRTLYDPTERDVLDQALVLLFAAPNSFTGEDIVELHCHGSRAVVRGVLDALEALGRPQSQDADGGDDDGGNAAIPPLNLRPAERGEFTQRAYARGKLGLCEVEALADLITADTSAQRKLALRQFDGRLSRLYDGWRAELVKCLAHAEAVIDFGDDEDLGPDDGDEGEDGEWDTGEAGVWDAISPRVSSLRTRMVRHLSDANRGELLRSGLRVAIVGPPNAGKSSLLNLLADRDAAIVSPVAGTTRDVVEVVLDLGGVRCVVSDTAGVRGEGEEGVNEIEVEGMRRARRAAGEAHVVVGVVDGTDGVRGRRAVEELLEDVTTTAAAGDDGDSDGDEEDDDERDYQPRNNRPDVLFVTNKIDLLEATAAADDAAAATSSVDNTEGGGGNVAAPPTFGISCETNDGVEAFLAALTDSVLRRVSGDDDDDASPDSSASPVEGEEGAVITRQRHRRHVLAAAEALERFESLSTGGHMAADMAAEELRLACSELGRVTGAVDVEDVLDVLFADFCIGK